jgi:hypothetical protein
VGVVVVCRGARVDDFDLAFTGDRTMSDASERTAQRLVAGSFLLLVPFFVYEAVHRLIVGSDTSSSVLGIVVTSSAIVLMPGLGWAKLRLGRALRSGATAGEGVQNLMCAVQAAAALIALVGASAGLTVIDPIAALMVAGDRGQGERRTVAGGGRRLLRTDRVREPRSRRMRVRPRLRLLFKRAGRMTLRRG